MQRAHAPNLSRLLGLTLLVGAAGTAGATPPTEEAARDKAAAEPQASTLAVETLRELLFDPWGSRYERVAKVAASTLRSKTPEAHARRLYLLERELVDLILFVDRRKDLQSAQRRALIDEAVHHLGQLQWGWVSTQNEMRARVEAQKQGSTGTTLVRRVDRKIDQAPYDLYYPSYRQHTFLSDAEMDARYREARAAHDKAHPGKVPAEALTAETLAKVQTGELIEWVAPEEGPSKVTRHAKHVVAADGKPVRSDGGLRLYWSSRRERARNEKTGKRTPLFGVLGFWSGTYQPDGISPVPTMQAELRALGIPRRRLIATPNMPVSTKMYEVLLESGGMDSKAAKARARRLERAADRRATYLHGKWTRALRDRDPRRAARRGKR